MTQADQSTQFHTSGFDRPRRSRHGVVGPDDRQYGANANQELFDGLDMGAPAAAYSLGMPGWSRNNRTLPQTKWRLSRYWAGRRATALPWTRLCYTPYRLGMERLQTAVTRVTSQPRKEE